jgi:ubiquinone/menaquinone biosynthesis C-methylase UbiE
MQKNERTFNVTDVHKLEDPERPKWLPPDEAVRLLGLKAGVTVADVGAGTGYFAIPFAGAVAQVYAVDPQPELLAILKDKLRQPGMPSNILLVQGTAAATELPSACCEVVFLANVWHELDEHRAVLREAARVLTPGGRIGILDWRIDMAGPPGPPAQHRISMEEVIAMLRSEGWGTRHSDPLGRYSYMVVASRVPSAISQ